MITKIKNTILKNKQYIIIFILILIFAIITRSVFRKELIVYDELAKKILVDNLRSDQLTLLMKVITSFGNGLILVLICFLSFLIFHNKNIGILVSLNLIFITILNNILKLIIQRPRPSGFNLIIESGYSFPSGHSMVSTAFYGFLIYLLYKKIKNKNLRRATCFLLSLLIILICISRVYLGVHYASDVIGGFFVSLSYLIVYIMIIPKIVKIIDKKSSNATKG